MMCVHNIKQSTKKAILSLAVVVLSLSTLFAQEKAQEVSAEIEGVTVFTNNAEITRAASFRLEEGRNIVEFVGLSTLINPQSIRVEGEGFTMQSVVFQKVPAKQEDIDGNPELKALLDKKKELDEKIAYEKALVSILVQEQDILLSNKAIGGEERIETAELRTAMDYFRSKLTEIETAKLDKQKLLKELNEEVTKINQQISVLRTGPSKATGKIAVVMQASAAKQIEVSIKYVVSSAGWIPSYDIRVNSLNEPMAVTYKANVSQATGIDWKDVQLTISSGNPQLSATAPSLSPWYLNFPTYYYNEVAKSGTYLSETRRSRKKMESASAPSMEYGDVSASEDKEYLPVTEIQRQTSFAYRIELPYNIRSNNQRYAVEMITHEIDANYRYKTTPKLLNNAFLIAEVADWGQYNFLTGSANLYLEDSYVGASQLYGNYAGDTLRLSLGRDESIVVERKSVKDFKEKRLLGTKRKTTKSWEISIRNTKSTAIDITLEDQVPISGNEAIEIEVEELSGAKHNKETGKLQWKLNIAPNETKKVVFRYSVEYPRNKDLYLE